MWWACVLWFEAGGVEERGPAPHLTAAQLEPLIAPAARWKRESRVASILDESLNEYLRACID